ncbi:4-hydroxy-tetrahydrodipicolinate synthase [Fulvitalea axinellae]|uniref:4-hydroxy-tetrahydrodipicolinate synthase n=1 Tax=Fulvitalea axinellae TaxID=1182444 RepID=A0AAU9CUE8_9BACT|nr:4-hydroxy-tetrahydrodipicolinate synthase [Fulvitalea axinellae]
MRNLKGSGVALVTPFTEDHEIDFESLGNILRHTAQDSDYWVVMGTTGESATLEEEEKQEVLSFVLDNNPENLPIVYGVGGNDTRSVVKRLKQSNLEGVDAVLSVSPYYNKPSQEGIIRHFTAVADASPKPVILYNVPGRTGSNMSAETTLKLAEHENIIGIKEASGDLNQCIEIAKHKPADFLLISGDDMLTTSLISFGGAGVISVLANAFPALMGKMTNAALQGDFGVASNALFALSSINPHMYTESNPVGVKAAMEILGVCKGHVRLPLAEASEGLRANIEAEIKKMGL